MPAEAPHVFLDSVAPPTPPPLRVLCEVLHSTVMFDSGDLSSCGRFCLMSRPLPERRRRPSSIRAHFLPSLHLHARVQNALRRGGCLYFISLSSLIHSNSVIFDLLFSD